MDCKKAEALITQMNRSDLERGLDGPLAGHLDECVECRTSLELVKLLQDTLTEPRPKREPDWNDFTRQVEHRLIADAYYGNWRGRINLGGMMNRLFRPAFGMGLATAALILAFFVAGPSLYRSDSKIPTSGPASTSVNTVSLPATLISSPMEDRVSLHLDHLSREELSYVNRALLRRVAAQERLDGIRDDIPSLPGIAHPDEDVEEVDYRLTNLEPGELQRISHALEHMIPN